MRKLIVSFLLRLLEKDNKKSDLSPTIPEVQESTETTESLKIVQLKEHKPKKIKGPKPPPLSPQEIAILAKERAARDLADMMEVPFLALSKNRKESIIYEKHDGPNMIKVKVSRHVGH